MAINTSLFLNQFQKGSSENANIGFGAFVGVETYSKKGVAQLTKDSTKVSASVVTDLPIYFTSHTASLIFAQGDTGKVYVSTDGGTTWTDMTNADGGSSGSGRGLMWYNGYLFAFRGGKIDYTTGTTTSWTQTNWQPNGAAPGIISTNNFPFIFPNDGNLYFANGYKIGKIGFGTGATFDPATPTTGYSYTASAGRLTGLLPQSYQINCISFLPSNFIALGTGYSGIGQASQIADVILWNPTLSTYETPLRLFSQAGAGSAGVNQIINRNNVLYAVTAGNHAIFSTNGSSFALIDDISINMSSRFITAGDGTTGTGNTNGIQSTSPIFLNPFPSAIAVVGNKLMSAVSTSINSTPTGYGLFPLGVWSEAFQEGGNSLQCEFTISSGVICSKTYSIGAIYPIFQAQILIGWFDGTNYGIDKTEFLNYQNDANVVWIESELFEIGTPLEPAVITTIQENIVRSLVSGQTVSVYWRTAFDQAYTLLETFDANDGDVQLNNSLKTVANSIGAAKFLQLRLSMATSDPNLVYTPELRNVIIDGSKN